MTNLLLGDCLELMQQIPDASVDAIICDPPYGTTACKWDSVIDFSLMWAQLNRIIKPNGAIVLFGSEPFSSALRMSNIKNYKYDWIWQKNKTTGFLNAKKQPMNDNENIIVFYKKQCNYTPQMVKSDKAYKRGLVKRKKSDCYGEEKDFKQVDSGFRYPKRIQYFNNNDTLNQQHPTQKPVELMEYLIKTYTNEGETVLDFTMGSGSTGVAAMNTYRNFIGIETDQSYFDIATKRIEDAQEFNNLI
jgi:DNA modification methylase